jgi:hypothetical protein
MTAINHEEQTIYGRPFTIHQPTILKHVKYGKRKPAPRFHVDGINKADGKPVRFKSLVKAERHMKNFGLDI